MRRATAWRAVARGQAFARAAEQAGFRSRSTVAELVARVNQRGRAALTIAAGRGRPATDDSAARARRGAGAGRSYQKTRPGGPTGTALRVRERGVVRVVDPQTEDKRG